MQASFNQSATAQRLRARFKFPAEQGRSRASGEQARPAGRPNIVPIAAASDNASVAEAMLEAIAAAGATAEVMLAACKAALQAVTGASPAHATDATLHATPAVASGKSSTERSRDCRAKKRDIHMQRRPVASVARPSLSLVENIDSQKEREEAPARETKPSPGLMPLPQDFQPTAARLAGAVKRLGEVPAAIMLENFRNHYGPGGPRAANMLTAAGWQRRYTSWSESEHLQGEGPAQLPLMRSVATGPPPAPTVFIRLDSPEWNAWKRFRNGKALPIDRSGGWHVPTRWPPNHGDLPCTDKATC